MKKLVKAKSILMPDVEITIVDVRGDKVRIGITAPKKIAQKKEQI